MNISEKLNLYSLGRAMFALALAAAPAWLPSCLPAQSIAVSSPSTSFIFDAGRSSIRPLIGFAGSSFLGDAALTGVQFASVAPNGISAVVVWPDRVEWVADLSKYWESSSLIGGSLTAPNQIFWDKTSAFVVFSSSSERQVQFLQRTGGGFTLRTLAAPDSCTGSLKTLAADAANAVAAVLCTPDKDAAGSQNLFLVQPNAAPALVQLSSAPVAAAFALNGAFYAAGADSTISVVRTPASSADAELLFTETENSAGAAALLVQSAEQLLYSADSTQRRIRVYDLNSFQKVDDLDAGWAPTQFQPFLTNSFLMNTGGASSEPRLLLRTAPQRSVLFVPAGD